MTLFSWLEQTDLAIWVNESLYGYPIVLCFHAVGLAIIVGLLLIVNLRMLNIIGGIPYQSLRGLTKLAWAGFVVNFISGLALFSARATEFVESIPFLVKIAAIFAAVALAGIFQGYLHKHAANWDDGQPVQAVVKVISALSIALWLAAIISGRLIAYLVPEATYF